MTSQTFLDPDLETRFNRDGYVVVPLLDADALRAVEGVYRDADPKLAEPFYTSMWSDDVAYRGRVNAAVKGALAGPVARFLDGFEAFVAGFFVKHADPREGAVVLHQDWSYGEESVSPTVVVWCPLRDVGPEDGCLGVIPGSHRIWDIIRPNGRDEATLPYVGHEDFLFDRCGVELPLRAGEAVLYDARLLHASRVNRSGRVRVAAGSASLRRGAQLKHYFTADPERMEHYDVPWDFYWRDVRPGERPTHPEARRHEDVPYQHPRHSREQLLALCERARAACAAP